MSVSRCLKFAQWQENTTIWIIRTKYGMWAASPPRWFIPAERLIELTQSTKRFTTELDMNRPGMYDLCGKAITFIRDAEADLSFLFTGPLYRAMQPPIIRNEFATFGETVRVRAEANRLAFITDTVMTPDYLVHGLKGKLIVRNENGPLGALALFTERPKITTGHCVVCGVETSRQSWRAGSNRGYWTCDSPDCDRILLEKLSENVVIEHDYVIGD